MFVLFFFFTPLGARFYVNTHSTERIAAGILTEVRQFGFKVLRVHYIRFVPWFYYNSVPSRAD